MDRIDREILGRLTKDARLSYRELGEQVHLSANAVAERVRRLQLAGAIRGFHADLDLAALGWPLQALVDVKLRPGVSATQFESMLKLIPGVLGAQLLTGTFDYLLRVACADQQDLVRVVEALRETAGAQETYSRLILRDLVVTNGMPD
ncbi:Lrp/AsnC family transcriptional regulator [Parachitinimonas caeni]|uniref:Lrp/AsnC family transcriptional regulator n=1 Tax=Parachitinimonas caeni TaxID=3031301 RepID=A0ABT7DSM3_9NEIS|nr:Lrp/AsnC family transcriptional regulator [Parachitinimonas caeni]MDK2123073.1 Lrp/AsnC family transcriptional regulator [Parachitinimonas caeni]